MKRRELLAGAALGAVAGATATRFAGQRRESPDSATELAAPAINKERVEIAMVTTWPRDFPGLGTGAQRFSDRIREASDGRLQVTYYAAGERVGAFDSFDEVASGNAQMYHAAEYYWKGKHPGFAYFSTVPFGLSYTEMSSWINWMGGQELWDELGREFGVKGLPCGNSGVQWGGWFNKEINSVEDFKGLKIRMPGLGGDVLAKLGASPVSVPGGQIYENLVSGTIDATEWVGPWNDEAMKFYEAASYYYYPGVHEPATLLALGTNLEFWEGLSESDRVLITAVAQAEDSILTAEYNAKNGAALNRLRTNQGVEIREFSEEVYAAFGRAAEEVYAEVVEHSDLARRIHESMVDARRILGDYQQYGDTGYILKRNSFLLG